MKLSQVAAAAAAAVEREGCCGYPAKVHHLLHGGELLQWLKENRSCCTAL